MFLQKITSDDLNRNYSPSDIKQLCLRTKVRVDMTLFNCVHEAKKRFEKKGRLANRSERSTNALLIKAVHKKMVVPYTQEEVAKCNHIRQCQLKKENNFRLDRWRHESSQSRVIETTCSSSHQSLLLAQAPNDNPPPNTQEENTEVIMFPISNGTESQSSTIGLLDKEPDLSVGKKIAAVEKTPVANLDWVEAAVEYDSESITLETQEIELIDLQTESQHTEDYIVFGTQVPATSTQTQCSEPLL